MRNLLLGCTRFNAIAAGLPGISRSLLSARLRTLEERGLVKSRPKDDGRGHLYEVTEAGEALWSVLQPLAVWGERWIALQPEHTDPSFALWAWVHVHLNRPQLPTSRVVVEFYFPEQPEAYRRFWVLFDPDGAELCDHAPGYATDIEVWARSEAFTHWHIGRFAWADAIAEGSICVQGPPELVAQLPTWNQRVSPPA